MFNYSDKERAEVQSRMESELYKGKPVDQAFMYSIYDILRIQLECQGEIMQLLKSIESKLPD